MTLSLTMIVKNESEVLGRALSNASVYADEIIVVDTGSTDSTKAVAGQFTDKVYDFEWIDDFSAARNFAAMKASSDYWMWLDADDIVSPEAARGIAKLMRKLDPSVDAVMLPYSLGNFSYLRERILRNSEGFRFRGRVHEAVPLGGKVINAPYAVVHAKPSSRVGGTRNLDIYKKMLAAGEQFEPRERYYFARELYFNSDYLGAAGEFEKFLGVGKAAFKPNLIDACLMLSRCYDKLGDKDRSMAALLRSLAFGVPTGEIACELGFRFFAENDYSAAAYWFERATRCKIDLGTGAFVDGDCYGFLPYVWLTVCYDRLGKIQTAYRWHCRAKKVRPEHPSVVANQAYFDRLNIGQ